MKCLAGELLGAAIRRMQGQSDMACDFLRKGVQILSRVKPRSKVLCGEREMVGLSKAGCELHKYE